MVDRGEFRSDLLFRLRSLTIHLPPLRERPEDIPLLTTHIAAQQCRLHGIETKGIAAGFLEALLSHDWPGNVRELVNAIEGAIVLAGDEPILHARHLPTHMRVHMARASYTKRDEPEPQHTGETEFSGPLLPIKEMREQFEKRYLQELVVRTNSDIEAACKMSGLSRAHVYSLLKKHGLALR